MSRRRSQDGFTLLVVLLMVGLFSLVLAALLGLVVTDTGTTAAFADTAAQRRDGDNALQVAVTRLKTANAASIASKGSCAGVDGSSVELGSTSVGLMCEEVELDDPPIASPGEGGTVLTLLGNYTGALDDGAENDIAGEMGTWVAGASEFLKGWFANLPGLLHAAGEPMRIVGDVKVRKSAFGLKTPAPSPAIDVRGNYTQGEMGAWGGQDVGFLPFFTLFTTPKCGLLSESFPVVPDLGLRLRTSGTRVCHPTGGPNAVAPETGPAVTAPATWSPAARGFGTALPSCTPGSVVTFTPGAYNYLQTRELNRWFEQGLAGCDDVTFWFPPGDYYFDVGGWFDGDRNSLTLDDPTSNWVFGAPRSWDPATGRAPSSVFPEACDRAAQGVSLTFSSRSVLKHRTGHAAICGRRDGSGAPLPAIYQVAGGETQTWAGVPTGSAALPLNPATGVTPRAFTPAANMLASIAPVPATFPEWGGAYATTEGATRRVATATCAAGYECTTAYRLSGFADPSEPAPSGQLDRAVLKIAGTATNVATPVWFDANSQRVRTYVRLTWGDGSGRACFVDVPDVPRSATNPMTIDLKAACGVQPYDLVDASQLEGATVEVYHNLIPTCAPFCATASSSIDYAWIETSTKVSPPSTFSTVVDPDAGNSLNVFGPVHTPSTQIEVTYAGSANRTPTFVGGVTARALASFGVDGNSKVGVVVAKALAPPRRRLLVRAIADGNVIGATEVEVTDSDASGLVQDPGRLLEVRSWTLCGTSLGQDGCTAP